MPFMATPLPVNAEIQNTPVVDFPGIDGVAWDFESGYDGSTYVAGNFGTIGVTGSLKQAVINPDGSQATVTPSITNSQPMTSVSDGAGGWYVGGAFTTTGGGTYNRLMHVLADGSINTGFNPNIASTVRALAFDETNDILYVGGDFSTVNGATTRNRIAAFDTNTGSATSFNPNVSGGNVYSLVLDSTNGLLYAGGDFTTVNGATTRRRVAAFSTSTGTANAFIQT